MRSSFKRSVRRRIVPCCLLLLAGASPAGAADPFYRHLVEDGVRAFDRGDYPAAAKTLKLGCFGLLEEPDSLARCLVYLAVAQGEIADVPAFARSFERILELERRFQAFSSLSVRASLRADFERHLVSWIPYETLAREPMFRHVARRKKESDVRALAPEERRAELERRIAVEPGHVAWRLLMADLDHLEGDFEAALAASEGVLREDPRQPLARCLRGLANAGLGMCEAALPDLDVCALPELRTRRIAADVQCLIARRSWLEADERLGELSPDELQTAPFRQLARELRRARRSSEPAPETIAEADAASDFEEPLAPDGEQAPAPSRDAPPSPRAVPSADPADDVSAELEKAREVLRRGSRYELEEVFDETRRLAERRPDPELQLLVAEIAYRLSRWSEAVSFFRSGGVTSTSRPEVQFYFAVSLYESGDQAAAQAMLQRCLPRLEPTDFVRAYAARINNGS